jgi:hypothetical protein
VKPEFILVICGVLAVLGLALALPRALRRGRCIKQISLAEKAEQSGDAASAADHYETALRLWDFNVTSQSAPSYAKDLVYLVKIATGIQRTHAISLTEQMAMSELQAAAAKLGSFYEDLGNFGIDKRMVKPKRSKEFAELRMNFEKQQSKALKLLKKSK